ncbi:hypothetical protein ACF1AJ_14985 [Leifsonia sp. NPDC014704]|uniref:hypothetical protein n=1 Tax=Leifsonia sp. NPDC014704 TaxID=3364123 RepID=UPI0036F49949
MVVDELIDVELSDRERTLLVRGLGEWGGPARSGEPMAVALGFESAESLRREGRRLAEAIAGRIPLTRLDWTRALLATEVVFASDVVGSGVDWATTTGLTDADTIQTLRLIQRTLAGVVIRPR